MTSVVEIGNFPDENSRFSKEFEEYRRACRERYQQNNPPQTIEEEAEEVEDESVSADSISSEDECPENNTEYPVLKDPRFTISPANTACNTTSPASPEQSAPKLSSSVESLRKPERRNSLSKMMSFCSNVFRKSTGSSSPTLSAVSSKEKERAKMEKKKSEQDWRMARFIAELEMEGRSDAEIQLHLFHLRDQAQFARPRSNSITEWFREMHQAFKDEFTARNERNLVTVHVSTVNPFSAAAPANYVHDMGYSYEDLVSLEPVPRGLKSLDHLPTTVYEGQALPSDQTSCAVCMADFEVTEELRSLHCTHHFHKECIDKWLGVAPTCPVCKGEVHDE
jgi:hypothetical protein